MNKTFESTEQFLISCRDMIVRSPDYSIFFSLRKLMSHFDSDYENYAKRISLLKENGVNIDHWRPIFTDAWSQGQVRSKIWLVKELLNFIDLQDKTIYVLGGWIGVLPTILFWHTNVQKVRNFELDESCIFISDWLLRDWVARDFSYKTIHKDMTDINYVQPTWSSKNYSRNELVEVSEEVDIIINTSCDHLLDFKSWWNLIPKGKIFAIQNNNFPEINDHHNWVEDLEVFKNQIDDASEIWFSGELETEKYKRFMIIGRK